MNSLEKEVLILTSISSLMDAHQLRFKVENFLVKFHQVDENDEF